MEKTALDAIACLFFSSLGLEHLTQMCTFLNYVSSTVMKMDDVQPVSHPKPVVQWGVSFVLQDKWGLHGN